MATSLSEPTKKRILQVCVKLFLEQGTRDDYAEKAKTVGVLREQNEDLRSLK